MKVVREILKSKGSEVYSVGASATMYEALERMAEKNVGALVVEDAGRWTGIISERDYARKSLELCLSPRDCRVSDLMCTEVFTIGPEWTLEDCMKLMTEKRVRHLPVLEGDAMIGLISIGDVVKALLQEKTIIITQLEGYITGSL